MEGQNSPKYPFFPFIEKSHSGILGTKEGLEAYFVNKRKRGFFLKFCSEMSMFILEALWPLRLSKITLEVLLLFLTDLNLSLVMKCQNKMAEKSNDCNIASGSVLLCMSHYSLVERDEGTSMARN